jgi:hypothetical protein
MPQTLVVLDSTIHKALTFSPQKTYTHAQNVTTTTLFFSEFIPASLSYPIFFSRSEEEGKIMAVALLGTEERGENIFIDKQNGHWQQGCYIPVSLSTYPFYAGPQIENGPPTILVDINAPHFKSLNGKKLFTEQGEYGPILEEVVNRFKTIKKESEQTTQLINQLLQAELLQKKNLLNKTGAEAKVLLNNCIVLDSERIATMSAETLQTFHKRGILPYIYALTASLSNLNHLTIKAENEQAVVAPHSHQGKSESSENVGSRTIKPTLTIAATFIGVAMLSALAGYHLKPEVYQEKSLEIAPVASISKAQPKQELKEQKVQPLTIDKLDTEQKSQEPPTVVLVTDAPQLTMQLAEEKSVPALVDGSKSKVVEAEKITMEPEPTTDAVTVETKSDSIEKEPEATGLPSSTVAEQVSVADVEDASTLSDSQPPPPTVAKPRRKNLEMAGLSSYREAELHNLVELARDDILFARLAHPRGYNALEKIGNIKKIYPDNPIAGVLLEEVFERYLKLATWGTEKKASIYLKKAESLFPGDERVGQVREMINKRDQL